MPIIHPLILVKKLLVSSFFSLMILLVFLLDLYYSNSEEVVGMKYQTILIDADDTILDFHTNEQESLRKTFHAYGLEYNDEVYAVYHRHNIALWKAFEEGKISKEEILQRRFRNTFDELNYHHVPSTFEEDFQEQLAQGGYMLPHAYDVIVELSKRADVYIVTNGVASTQSSRLDKSGLMPYLKGVFISEEIGYQKPHREYFMYIKEKIGYTDESTIIIGDSLSSDIQGGINANIDTCWYDPYYKENTKPCTYVIHDIRELLEILK